MNESSPLDDALSMEDEERLLDEVERAPHVGGTSILEEDCPTRRLYMESNQDKRLLIVLCLGLTTSQGDPLLNPSSEAWSAQRTDVRKPSRSTHYAAEVKRRGELLDVQPRPKPAQWNVEKMTRWLIQKPIQNPACVQFLVAEVTRVNAIFEEALRVKKNEKNGPSGLWVKNEPWLRLLHCILEDDIRPLYLQRDQVLTRPQLDALSSPDRPMSIYKRIALRWNDPLFNPMTVVSDCHEDFAKEIDIGWDAVVGDGGYAVPSEENVHHRLTDMRTKLVRIIKNWERSGQGEGTQYPANLDDEEEPIQNRDPEHLTAAQLGRLENRSAYAMHSCKNFLDHPTHGKVGSWILYYWQQMERFHLLECTINILSNEVNAPGAQSAPILEVETPASKKKRKIGLLVTEEDDDSAIRQVGDGLIQYVEASKSISQRNMLNSRRHDLEIRIYELSKTTRGAQMELLRCHEDEEKILLRAFIAEDEAELTAKKHELAAVMEKLKGMDSES
jgi:hypothetical protein